MSKQGILFLSCLHILDLLLFFIPVSVFSMHSIRKVTPEQCHRAPELNAFLSALWKFSLRIFLRLSQRLSQRVSLFVSTWRWSLLVVSSGSDQSESFIFLFKISYLCSEIFQFIEGSILSHSPSHSSWWFLDFWSSFLFRSKSVFSSMHKTLLPIFKSILWETGIDNMIWKV